MDVDGKSEVEEGGIEPGKDESQIEESARRLEESEQEIREGMANERADEIE